ncbi:MAG TPA: HEAT repeat domain-containing protein [Bryobacteraceae bacterium]|nr:HEAT repeat domain-containing protein [Bryobacteraceae bacterium]
MIRKGVLLIALAGPLVGREFIPRDQAKDFQAQSFQARQVGREDSEYQRGLSELDAHEWDKAIAAFDASASRKGSATDAALYWKAYAQNRAGLGQESLTTLSRLRQLYPGSRWLNDAQALEVEVRARSGTPVSPGAETDQDMKLMALNSLMTSNSDQALPILKKLLAGPNSDKLKERAMFVLVQNPSPEARKLLGDTARGSVNPDLQLKAIRYMGMMGGDESRKDLASIYGAAANEQVKRAILKSFMISGSRGILFDLAKSEKDPALRKEAIKQLALTGGQDELWQLYQSEQDAENKKAILQSMFLTGNSSKLADLAKTEKDPGLRASAIKSLGLMGGNGRGDVLVSIYQSDSNPEVRRAVLNSLFLQQNGKALVDLARAEKDPQMKQEIFKKMALVHSKEVTDYMVEILK